MEKAQPNADSINNTTIHLWSKPRSMLKKRSKSEILLEIRQLTGQIIDLNALTVSDLETVLSKLRSQETFVAEKVQGKEAHCVWLESNIKGLTSTRRLNLPDLKKLMEVLTKNDR